MVCSDDTCICAGWFHKKRSLRQEEVKLRCWIGYFRNTNCNQLRDFILWNRYWNYPFSYWSRPNACKWSTSNTARVKSRSRCKVVDPQILRSQWWKKIRWYRGKSWWLSWRPCIEYKSSLYRNIDFYVPSFITTGNLYTKADAAKKVHQVKWKR